jgi:hypothetical protein
MDRTDSNSSVVTAIPFDHKDSALQPVLEPEPAVPLVSYLGPLSSYTHQVYTLVEFMIPAWSISLTDCDLAQAALQCFDAEQYDYKPATTIPGYPQIPTPQSWMSSNMKLS